MQPNGLLSNGLLPNGSVQPDDLLPDGCVQPNGLLPNGCITIELYCTLLNNGNIAR